MTLRQPRCFFPYFSVRPEDRVDIGRHTYVVIVRVLQSQCRPSDHVHTSVHLPLGQSALELPHQLADETWIQLLFMAHARLRLCSSMKMLRRRKCSGERVRARSRRLSNWETNHGSGSGVGSGHREVSASGSARP